MKTVEEMRVAVLAECDTVCPNRDFPAKADWGHLMFGYVTYDGDDYEAWFLYVSASIHPISLYARSADQICIAAYRLLGLEARDAVAVANQRAQKAIQACADYAQSVYVAKDNTIAELQTRNTALVKALEEIRKPAMIIGFGKKATVKMRIDQLFEDHKRVRLIAKNALAANTEKGGVQG